MAAWDLSPLGLSADGATTALDALDAEAKRLLAGFNADSADWPATLRRLDELRARRDGIEAHAYLSAAANDDADAEDLLALVEQRLALLDERLALVVRAWVELADVDVAAALANAAIAPWRGYLAALRRRPRTDRATEEGLAGRAAAVQAWGQLHANLLVGLEVHTDAGVLSYQGAISSLADRDPAVRANARQALTAALRPHLVSLAASFDAVVADRLAVARLYGVADPLDLAVAEDDVPAEIVRALADALQPTKELVHRLVALRAHALGRPALSPADLRAPVGELPRFTYSEARDAILAATDAAIPALVPALESLFADRVDAESRTGKGFTAAFGVNRSAPSYVLASFSGELEDVVVLAHELGHALHFEQAFRRRTHLSARPTTPICEVAALTLELLVVEWLVETGDERHSLPLAFYALDRRLAATAYQVALFEFEAALYESRRSGLPLVPDRLGELWSRNRRELLGLSLEPEPGFELRWSGVGHILEDPFYNYSYALAYFPAAELADRLRAGEGRPEFLELLSAGGTEPTLELLRRAGVPVGVEQWRRGFLELERRFARTAALL